MFTIEIEKGKIEVNIYIYRYKTACIQSYQQLKGDQLDKFDILNPSKVCICLNRTRQFTNSTQLQITPAVPLNGL